MPNDNFGSMVGAKLKSISATIAAILIIIGPLAILAHHHLLNERFISAAFRIFWVAVILIGIPVLLIRSALQKKEKP